jgi:hypothetical protein
MVSSKERILIRSAVMTERADNRLGLLLFGIGSPEASDGKEKTSAES